MLFFSYCTNPLHKKYLYFKIQVKLLEEILYSQSAAKISENIADPWKKNKFEHQLSWCHFHGHRQGMLRTTQRYLYTRKLPCSSLSDLKSWIHPLLLFVCLLNVFPLSVIRCNARLYQQFIYCQYLNCYSSLPDSRTSFAWVAVIAS